jgi:hypothetical protein
MKCFLEENQNFFISLSGNRVAESVAAMRRAA